MVGVFIGIGVAVFAFLVGADIYLGRHPLKKADKRAEKFRYRGW